MIRIMNQNEALLRRIHNSKSTYHKAAWVQTHAQNEYLLSKIGRYPYKSEYAQEGGAKRPLRYFADAKKFLGGGLSSRSNNGSPVRQSSRPGTAKPSFNLDTNPSRRAASAGPRSHMGLPANDRPSTAHSRLVGKRVGSRPQTRPVSRGVSAGLVAGNDLPRTRTCVFSKRNVVIAGAPYTLSVYECLSPFRLELMAVDDKGVRTDDSLCIVFSELRVNFSHMPDLLKPENTDQLVAALIPSLSTEPSGENGFQLLYSYVEPSVRTTQQDSHSATSLPRRLSAASRGRRENAENGEYPDHAVGAPELREEDFTSSGREGGAVRSGRPGSALRAVRPGSAVSGRPGSAVSGRPGSATSGSAVSRPGSGLLSDPGDINASMLNHRSTSISEGDGDGDGDGERQPRTRPPSAPINTTTKTSGAKYASNSLVLETHLQGLSDSVAAALVCLRLEDGSRTGLKYIAHTRLAINLGDESLEFDEQLLFSSNDVAAAGGDATLLFTLYEDGRDTEASLKSTMELGECRITLADFLAAPGHRAMLQMMQGGKKVAQLTVVNINKQAKHSPPEPIAPAIKKRSLGSVKSKSTKLGPVICIKNIKLGIHDFAVKVEDLTLMTDERERRGVWRFLFNLKGTKKAQYEHCIKTTHLSALSVMFKTKLDATNAKKKGAFAEKLLTKFSAVGSRGKVAVLFDKAALVALDRINEGAAAPDYGVDSMPTPAASKKAMVKHTTEDEGSEEDQEAAESHFEAETRAAEEVRFAKVAAVGGRPTADRKRYSSTSEAAHLAATEEEDDEEEAAEKLNASFAENDEADSLAAAGTSSEGELNADREQDQENEEEEDDEEEQEEDEKEELEEEEVGAVASVEQEAAAKVATPEPVVAEDVMAKTAQSEYTDDYADDEEDEDAARTSAKSTMDEEETAGETRRDEAATDLEEDYEDEFVDVAGEVDNNDEELVRAAKEKEEDEVLRKKDADEQIQRAIDEEQDREREQEIMAEAEAEATRKFALEEMEKVELRAKEEEARREKELEEHLAVAKKQKEDSEARAREVEEKYEKEKQEREEQQRTEREAREKRKEAAAHLAAIKTEECGNCDENLATVRCEDCDDFYCASCDKKMHRGNSASHTRSELPGASNTDAEMVEQDEQERQIEEQEKEAREVEKHEELAQKVAEQAVELVEQESDAKMPDTPESEDAREAAGLVERATTVAASEEGTAVEVAATELLVAEVSKGDEKLEGSETSDTYADEEDNEVAKSRNSANSTSSEKETLGETTKDEAVTDLEEDYEDEDEFVDVAGEEIDTEAGKKQEQEEQEQELAGREAQGEDLMKEVEAKAEREVRAKEAAARLQLAAIKTEECGNCDDNPATVHCEDCDDFYCASCDGKMHRGNSASHYRSELPT